MSSENKTLTSQHLIEGTAVGMPPLPITDRVFTPWVRYRGPNRRVFFTEGPPPSNLSVVDNLTLGYRPEELANRFLGLHVPASMRGHRLGSTMLQWLTDFSGSSGLPLAKSCEIRKPGIALLLKNSSWRPDNTDALAEILTTDTCESPPEIQWLLNRSNRKRSTRFERGGNAYYRLVGEEIVRTLHPPINPNNPQVHLYTTFSAPTLRDSGK